MRPSLRSSLTLLALALALAACGEPPAPEVPTAEVVPVTPPPEAAPPPSAAPSTAPSAAASGAASAGAAASKSAKGPARWADFPGPKKPAAALASKTAWGVVPVGLDGEFDIVKIALEGYGKPLGDVQVLLSYDKSEIHVPAVLVKATAAAKGLTKGDAMMVNVAAASGYGRVLAVSKGDDGGERIKFRYEWAGSASEQELPADEVLPLEDKVTFGHPVAYKESDGWRVGVLCYVDETASWIIGATGAPKQVPAKDLKAMKIKRPLARGAKVSAVGRSFSLEPAKVIEVLDDGVRYKVKFDGGGEETVSMDEVTAPL